MTSIAVTEADQLSLRERGFVVLRGALAAEELAVLTAELQHGLERSYGPDPVSAELEQAVNLMGPDTPASSQLLETPALLQLTRAVYGADALGIATYGTSHVGDTGWHSDSPHDFPVGVKFSIYVSPVDAESGALRVLAGSHRGPERARVRELLEGGASAEELDAVVVSSEPGDIVAFDLRIVHAAFGGDTDRRVLNTFYYENPRTEGAERQTLEQIIEDFEWLADKNRADACVFHPRWLANEGGDEDRAAWIARFDELGFFSNDPERTGRLDKVVRGLPDEVRAQLSELIEGLSGSRWHIARTSSKRELARIIADTPSGELMILVRPADDPHPHYRTGAGLAFGYSTLNCEALDKASMKIFDAFIDGVVAGPAAALIQAVNGR